MKPYLAKERVIIKRRGKSMRTKLTGHPKLVWLSRARTEFSRIKATIQFREQRLESVQRHSDELRVGESGVSDV